MANRRFTHTENYNYKVEPRADIFALWGLRALIYLKGHRSFIRNHGFSDDDILNLIGLSELTDISDIKRKPAKDILLKRLSKLELKKTAQPKDIIWENITWLGKTLSLTNEEQLILLYSILVSTISDLRDAMNTANDINIQHLSISLSKILDIPIEKCKQALTKTSSLISSGLITIDYETRHFGDKFTPLPGLADTLLEEHLDKQNILNKFFEKSPTAKLKENDFEHISSDFQLVHQYLKSVSSRRTMGVNILIHGEPGVGKTEFVRMLVESLDLNLYEITMKDKDGDAISGDNRFSVYQLSQNLLSNQEKCIILFDEIEDVFPEPRNSFLGSFGAATSKSSGKKAWINHLLENNITPTFWLSNQVQQIDTAYLRRFDYVMELKQPSRSGRKRIINKYLHHLNVNEKWISEISNNEHIAPAFIEKAAKVIEHISGNHEKSIEHSLDKVIGNTLEIFGHKNIKHVSNDVHIEYSIDYLNTDHNISNICDGLKNHGSGRLCLYGPPGTGKTALGHHIAEHIDKPLIIKRGSDIISMYVGGTEENIANMFRQASDEDAVLLLDEADSFIQSRQSAQHSWEITQVNELLVQMENFQGVFIASTNLLEILDSASLRRFDFKIQFDYMKNNEAIAIFNNIVTQEQWKKTLNPTEVMESLNAISNLALGDFLVALRKMTFSQNKTTTEFLNHIKAESKIKPDARSNEIGFSANIH